MANIINITFLPNSLLTFKLLANLFLQYFLHFIHNEILKEYRCDLVKAPIQLSTNITNHD